MIYILGERFILGKRAAQDNTLFYVKGTAKFNVNWARLDQLQIYWNVVVGIFVITIRINWKSIGDSEEEIKMKHHTNNKC